jgi:hypothetical protein
MQPHSNLVTSEAHPKLKWGERFAIWWCAKLELLYLSSVRVPRSEATWKSRLPLHWPVRCAVSEKLNAHWLIALSPGRG